MGLGMLSSFLTKKNIGMIAAGIAILVVFLYWKGRTNEIEDLREDKINLQTELHIKETQYKENLAKLTRQIEDQNAKIAKAAKDSEILSSELTEKLDEAKEIAENLQKDLDNKEALIDTIETLTCQEGVDLMVDLAISNKWYLER